MADGTNYSAGNLEFVVQEISDKTISKLDLLQGKLQTILNTLSNVSSLTRNLGTTVGRTSSSNSSGGASSNIKDTNKELKVSSISMTKLINKVYFLRNYTKQMFRSVSDIVNKAVDYTETLNLWQVAMRGNTAEAENFVKTMNKAYGIATQTLMEYQAIFKNMLSSLGGISGDTSYALSEYLTQMAIDYASLYNVSIERAMTTFQSVLSGQVRPIRSIAGYDITETTIYQLYQQLGGTKTMRQLSQTEKRLLRIYAVFQQMESSGAIGDLGKTMGSTANQMRMFTEQTKEFGTWVGLIFESWLRPILPKLNAFMITLTNITKAYAQLKGIKPQEFGVIESMEQLDEVMDEVQGKLLSFDRFEALNSSADSNILGIDANLLAGLSKYSTILGNVTGEAQTLAEQWTKLFIDPETGKFTKLIYDIQEVVKSLGIVLGIVLFISKPLLALLTALTTSYLTDERFKRSVDEFLKSTLDLVKQITPLVIQFVKDVLPILTNFLKDVGIYILDLLKDTLPMAVEALKVGLPLLKYFIIGLVTVVKWGNEIIKALWEMILEIPNAFATAWKFIANTFASIINAIANKWINFINFFIDSLNNSPIMDIINLISKWTGGEEIKINRLEEVNWKPYDDMYQPQFNKSSFGVSDFKTASQGFNISRYLGANNNQVGDVILDGKKVGVYTSKYSHNENVRAGRVRATAY